MKGFNYQSKLIAFRFLSVAILFLILSPSIAAQLVAGSDTITKINGQWQYYDFTSQTTFTIADTATYTPDFRGSSNEGVNFGQEFSPLIPDRRLLLLGVGNIDTLTSVPEWTDAAPWIDTSWDFTHGTQGQPISPGQLWVVYTSEGLYAVMQIDELPGGNFGDSFTFKYKYMSEGGTTLEESNLNQGSGDQISGNTTLNSGNGFDLSGETNGELEDAGNYLPDFVFVNNEGVNFGNEGSTSLSTTGRRFLLLGEGNLDTLTTIPERVDAAPWVSVSYDFSDGTGGQPISAGQLWGVYTREGNYAAIEITALPGGNFGQSFDFKYKYQPNGSNSFDADTSITVESYSIAIQSGNNQTITINQSVAENLVVLVTDSEGNPASGQSVNFNFSSIPDGATGQGGLTSPVLSDENGFASTGANVGNVAGIYTVEASLDADSETKVAFTITAEEPTGPQPATLVIAGGNNQSVVLGDTIANPFEIVVIDDIGEPMNGITVTFEESEIPAGAISGSFFTIDGIAVNQSATFNNRAYMNYTPGDIEGTYSIKAFLADYPAVDSVVFTVNGELVSTPQNFQANAGIESVELSWDLVNGAVAYRIYRTLNDDNPASASLLATVTEPSYVDDSVSGDQTYFYWLYSVDVFDNQSATAAGPLSATPSSNQAGEIISGSATSTFGTGFDFSLQQTGDNEDEGDYQLDFAFVSNEGVNFGNEGSSSLSETGRRFYLLGEGSLESVTEVPIRQDENPWVTVSYDFSDGTGGQPISVGELWAVYTREGDYAVMEITGLPEGGFGDSFTFDYLYQSGGSNVFGDVEPVVPDTMIIAAGNNQVGTINTTLEEALMVQVLDENELPADGLTINFAVISVPENSEGASVSESSVITNSEGNARVLFTLGDTAGEYIVEASAENLNSVQFTIIGEEVAPPNPVTLLKVRDGFVDNSLIPEWNQSTAEDFLYYKVYMAEADGELQFIDSTRVGTQFSQDTAKAIFDLTEFVEYTFAVSVVNSALLESELSNQLSATPYPTPGEIQNFTATAGDGAVQLDWSPSDTSYFGFYELTVNTRDGELVMQDSIFNANDTSYVVSNLENDNTYLFLLSGVNEFGKAGFAAFASAIPTDSYVEESITLPNLIDGTSSWADVDGDGDMDLLMTGRLNAESNPETYLFLNDGTGTFTDSNEEFIGVINSTVFWQDIDQNGYVDVLISGETADGSVITKVYFNNEGSFTDAELVLPAYADGMISPADFDNDGDTDLLVAGDTGEGYVTALLENNGNQTFELFPFEFIGYSKAAAAWGDYNADGFLDFIITGELEDGTFSTTVYQSIDANSFFVKEGTFQGVNSGAVSFADLDVDGDLDILISGYTDAGKSQHFTGIYHYNGLDFELFFSIKNPPSKSVESASARSTLQLGDFDNDGDQDVLINSNMAVSILKNKRSSFDEISLDVSGSSVTWADFDGDGDLDIIASGSGGAKVLTNTTAIVNTPPTVPTNAMASIMMDSVKFSWNPSADAQTPANILTYNLRVGSSPGSSDVVSANANLQTGKLLSQVSGNVGRTTSFTITGLANGTYYWQVQAVDNGFAGSMFTTEQSFTVDNSPVSSEIIDETPLAFELKQNYPNPFNPSTNIEFSVPNSGLVVLEIYDINGRKIQELVNETLSAGSYTATFDASSLASGLYLYRLRTAANVLTRKMTLIK